MKFSRIRYRNAVGHEDSPVKYTKNIQFTSGPLKGYYEAYSYLNQKITKNWNRKNKIYGNSSGTGTAKNLVDAIYISVSEAIERWAFIMSVKSKMRH